MSSTVNAQMRRLLSNDSGNSATEFALILPMLVVLLFGMAEVGRLIFTYSIVGASTRGASRYASHLSMTCGGITNAGDVTSIQRLARTGTIDSGGAPVIGNWTSNASVTVAVDCISNAGATYSGSFDGLTQIPRVTVTAVAPYSPTLGGLLPMITVSSITARHAEIWTP